MRVRLTRPARSRAGVVLGLAGTALLAVSDRLFGISADAVQHREFWPD